LQSERLAGETVLAQSIQAPSATKRAQHYRELAAAAMNMAENAPDPKARASYVSMATAWHKLALEAERPSESPQVIPPDQHTAERQNRK
jgi:hypothetical protein